MTHDDPAFEPANPAILPPPVAPETLAAILAARLCHDLMSPASGIVAGLDLLDDPAAKDMRAEAMDLIGASARKLIDSLTFYRMALGPGGSGDLVDVREVEALARGLFSHVRPTLDWAVGAVQLPAIVAKALLNMVQIAAASLAAGGVARVTVKEEAPWRAIIVKANGPRARLWPEVLTGLRGHPMSEGLAGRWVQAYYLHAMATAAGAVVAAEVGDGVVTIRAAFPL